jgi:hypothetical protein
MTIESLKKMVTMAITVAKTLAKLTATDTDDKAVAFIEQISASETVWTIVAALLGLSENGGGGGNDNGLIMLSGAAAGEVKLSAKGVELASEVGVSEANLQKALKDANVSGMDLGMIIKLVQLAIAIFSAIKKK